MLKPCIDIEPTGVSIKLILKVLVQRFFAQRRALLKLYYIEGQDQYKQEDMPTKITLWATQTILMPTLSRIWRRGL